MTERRYDGMLDREIPLFAQHCIWRIQYGGRDESSLRQVLFRFVFLLADGSYVLDDLALAN